MSLKVTLRDSLAPNLKVLQILGYWPPENDSTIKRSLYITYATTFISFTFIIFIISEIIMISLSVGDLEKLTEASLLLLTHIAQVFKLYFFTINNRRIKDLANSLERDIFQPRTTTQRDMLLNAMFQAKTTFYVFISMALSTCLLWAVFPFIDSDADGTISLPLSAFYPFRTDYTPVFQIIFVYQIVATAINAATNVSMDTTASAFLAHICGQLDLLNDRLIHLKDFATELFEVENVGVRNCIRESNELLEEGVQREMDRMLYECVEHHNNILQFSGEVGVLFNVSVLSQFAAGAIIICLTMFKLTLVSIYSIQFVSMVLYQGCMLVEIALYCWFGNEIILKSSKLPLSAYSSDWTHCSLSFKKNMLFLMMRSMVPIKLYAGNFFTLSIETLAAILRSSWSYFAVLRRVHD